MYRSLLRWKPSGRPTKHLESRKGVSLIDLTICILVMGILSAVSLPRFASTVSRLRCEAAAKRIASDLNYARRIAVQTSRVVTVNFRSSPAGYDMTNVTDPASPSRPYSINLSDVDSGVSLVSSSFNGGSFHSYNNYGRPMVGSNALTSGTVGLRVGEHTFQVVVNPATGETIVQ